MPLRIYVAGPFIERARALAVAALLRQDGHLVVSRWHDRVEPDVAERDLPREFRRMIADENYRDLRHANLTLVLARPEIKGALCELVYAWSQGQQVLCVGDYRDLSAMTEVKGVDWVDDVDAARLELARRGAR